MENCYTGIYGEWVEVDMNNHTFVVCAYKESEYLEECVRSLVDQEEKSHIIIVTSTPNQHIQSIADKYNLALYVNEGEKGIVQDWTFGYQKATTKYITIAHQDDVYHKDFSKKVIARMNKEQQPLIAFTDYGELRNGTAVVDTKMLKIKRLMLLPLRVPFLERSRWVRRRILSFGNPICCPSVTFARENMPEKIFNVKYRACEDWEAWEQLSRLKGAFLYVSEILIYHRIHEESETSIIIQDNVRTLEDYDMFCKFWPKSIAGLINRFYSKAQDSNGL